MFSDIVFRLRALFRRRVVEEELDDELRFHIEQQTARLQRPGLTREEATRQTRLRFGGLGSVKEDCRESRGVSLLETTGRDIRYALRQMRKSPGFTVVLLTLALGIGVNASVFSVLNAVAPRPLEFPNADRLVQITSLRDGKPVGVSAPDVKDFAAQGRSFAKLAVYDEWRKNVSAFPGGENPEELLVGLAPREPFEALGVQPLLGRLFSAEEGLAGRNRVTLITETFWRTRFQREARILGRTLTHQQSAVEAEAETMSAYLSELTSVQRFTSVILSCFAGLGLLLVVVGIYGVIAYLVAQRTQEIGIRLALGAPRSAVVWLVSSQGLRMVLTGIAVGLLGTALVARGLVRLLYGISALDPLTLGAASIGLIAVALAACALPARRAARIDSVRALRTE